MQITLNSSAKRELLRIIGSEHASTEEINATLEVLTASESVSWKLQEDGAFEYDNGIETGRQIQFN